MPKRDAPKQNKGVINESRPNKKARKKRNMRPQHLRTPLTECQKVMLGGGMYANVGRRWAQNA